jgi:hypothetical protein
MANEVSDPRMAKLLEDLQRGIENNIIEEAVRDNKVSFDYKDSKYRVHRPTFKDKQDAYKEKARKHIEFLKSGEYETEESLKKILKSRGVDISEIDTKTNDLMLKRNDIFMKMGEMIKEKRDEKDLLPFKDELEKINSEIGTLGIKKYQHLEYSLENQINVYSYLYMTYLVSEKMFIDETTKEEKYVKCWNSYSDFEKENEELVNKCALYTSLFVQGEV